MTTQPPDWTGALCRQVDGGDLWFPETGENPSRTHRQGRLRQVPNSWTPASRPAWTNRTACLGRHLARRPTAHPTRKDRSMKDTAP